MEQIVFQCKELICAYKNGELGQTNMPEDTHPIFKSQKERLAYFTLPMALNYQRNSYKLWEAALQTFEDKETRDVFDLEKISTMKKSELKKKLTKHKLALQPNKQTQTWHTISRTLFEMGGIEELFEKAQNDFLELKRIIQIENKKGFPYLSGPKIFNYWSWIIQKYGGVKLSNSKFIEIAPDTHITKCSVLLRILTEKEAGTLSKEEINLRWREVLKGSGINPINMHAPLWFWSRNGFLYKLKK